MALIAALVPASLLVSGHSATGGVLNVPPTFSGPGAVTMAVSPSTVDNSGSDTIEFDATFFDANGDTDVEIVAASSTLRVFEGSDNGGTLVQSWTGIWDGPPSATEFAIDPTGTAGDGSAFIADSYGGDDPGYVWTIPTTLTGNAEGVEHYVEFTVEDDDGISASTGANFNVISAIQIEGIFRQDGTAVDLTAPFGWTFPESAPGTTAVSSGDGTDEFWLVLRNSGSDPVDSFSLEFIDDTFESASTLQHIPIDGAIDFEYYEGTAAPGMGDDPVEHGSTTTAADDQDGIWENADFTSVDNYMWIRYEVDIPLIAGDANDYVTSFTVVAD